MTKILPGSAAATARLNVLYGADADPSPGLEAQPFTKTCCAERRAGNSPVKRSMANAMKARLQNRERLSDCPLAQVPKLAVWPRSKLAVGCTIRRQHST